MDFQEELDKITGRIAAEGGAPSLLLHSCCGPCSSYVLEDLSRFFKITLYYYNPNTAPEEEYKKRLDTQLLLLRSLKTKNPVEFVEGEYILNEFYKAVHGLENEPEGGARCEKCFRLRMKSAACLAKERGADWFTTTLSVSPHKNAKLINEIGRSLEAEYGVKWLPSDFKRRGGYVRSVQLSKDFGLYRQNYCGCVYSLNARDKTDGR